MYNAGRLVANADVLYWQARRQGLNYASFVDPIWLTPGTIESLNFDRDPGVRVGLGCRFESAWDVTWHFSYFGTDAAGSVDSSLRPDLDLIATKSAFDLTVDSVAARASLDYQVHDLEAGRRFLRERRDGNATVRWFPPGADR